MRPQTRSLRRSTTRPMYGFFMLFQFLLSWSAIFASHDHDRITFFNVGQGHATLVTRSGTNKQEQPFYPLLIDAGTKSRTNNPLYVSDTHLCTGHTNPDLAKKISDAVFDAWKTTHPTIMASHKRRRGLNIIITHPDEDHKNLLPDVLKNLRDKIGDDQPQPVFQILVGGTPEYYAAHHAEWITLLGALNSLTHSSMYTQFLDEGFLLSSPQLDLELHESGCITGMFCPQGITETPGMTEAQRKAIPNTWSIITHVRLKNAQRTTALITGDAEKPAMQDLVRLLTQAKVSFRAHILLYPHHGGNLGKIKKGRRIHEHDNPKLPEGFRREIDPDVVVFGAGPSTYKHPQADAILCLLESFQGIDPAGNTTFTPPRLYKNIAPQHTIFYANDTNKEVSKKLDDRTTSIILDRPDPLDPLKTLWTHAWVDILRMG